MEDESQFARCNEIEGEYIDVVEKIEVADVIRESIEKT